jgi:hypothetical protein
MTSKSGTAFIGDEPLTVTLDHKSGRLAPSARRDTRRVSDMALMFSDTDAVQREIAAGD